MGNPDIPNNPEDEQTKQENQDVFKREFGDESNDFSENDQRNLDELAQAQGFTYNKDKTKEENLQDAFQKSMGDKIKNSYNNMKSTPGYNEVLHLMNVDSCKGDTKELLALYQKAKDIIDTREGESAKGTEVNQKMDQFSQEQARAESEKSNTNFLDKLTALKQASNDKIAKGMQQANHANQQGETERTQVQQPEAEAALAGIVEKSRNANEGTVQSAS